MGRIAVFDGLGSDALFNDATRLQATRDTQSLRGQILLELCHQTFVEEVSLLSDSTQTNLDIDLEDFQQPMDIIQIPQQYHGHPILQHATLSLIQLLRYQCQISDNSQPASPKIVATTGLCAGLFAAVAVATAKDWVQYLARAKECFRINVVLGIAIERLQEDKKPFQSNSPMNVLVAGIAKEDISKLLSKYMASKTPRKLIYISSLNNKSNVTISGDRETLREFTQTELPAECSVKDAKVFSLYHNSEYLQDCRESLLKDIEARQLPFPSRKDLIVPVISNIDGFLITPTHTGAAGDLLRKILDMILMEAINWVAVQDTIASMANKEYQQDQFPLVVSNYGPRFNALSGHKEALATVKAFDMSLDHIEDPEPKDDDIAIVGVGLNLPDASNLSERWENLRDGVNSCSEIPSDRFCLEDYYQKDSGASSTDKRSIGTKFGNFLKSPFFFDNELFGISPRESYSMDPQQRLMLQAVYRSLESAGYTPDSTPSFSRETFGCFIGNATLDYADNLKSNIDVYYSPGTLRAFLSGRISYSFKWSGPSVTIDTACSSSLVAIHQAVLALSKGECNAAIAGGVNLITSPDMFIGLDRAHFLSPTGQCKPFDSSADGYCRSEGCVAFVLKRLRDAVKEDDRILGVIKATAINQSGAASSITHPHSPTQERLFRELLSRSRIHPHSVSVVEAHGTGTQAGDPNEISSIRNIFCESRSANNPLYVTSIKSNVGHCEAASGAASLAKLILMLKNTFIPPQSLFKNLNPQIKDLGKDGTLINTEGCEWISSSGKRRTALLNNFGAAGSNAALILQEYHVPKKPASYDDSLTYVFGCSARSEDLLQQLQEEMVAHLAAKRNELSLLDICYTSTARRTTEKYRLCTTASSVEDLIENLKHARISKAAETTYSVVFLFSGQGSQYMGMVSELMSLFRSFRKTITRCRQILIKWGFPGCHNIFECDASRREVSQDPVMVQSFQTAIFALEVALARILMESGIKPSAVAGHSLGEYAALVIAGVISIENGLWLVAHRAHFICKSCNLWKSSMLAVNMSSNHIQQELWSCKEFEALSICCENSPNDCVVGGERQTLQQFQDHLSSETKTRTSMLEVPIAYHTAALDPVTGNIKQVASQVPLSPTTIPIASNVLGRVVLPGEDVYRPEYFAQHCRRPVLFDSAIADLLKQDSDLATPRWVEVGPHPSLLPMIALQPAPDKSQMWPVLKKGKHPSETLSSLFSATYHGNSDINWRAIFETLPSKPNLVDLPPVPMHLREYRVPYKREATSSTESGPESKPKLIQFTLLDSQIEENHQGRTVFETSIQSLMPFIKGHTVYGVALCPASICQEVVLAAVLQAKGPDVQASAYKVSDMVFSAPIIPTEQASEKVRTTLESTSESNGPIAFKISTQRKGGSSQEKLNASGTVKLQSASKAPVKLRTAENVVTRRRRTLFGGEHQVFSTATMYQKIFSRVVEYDMQYQTVRKLYMDNDAEEIVARCELQDSNPEAYYVCHHLILDTMLHVVGFVANFSVENQKVCICQRIQSLQVFRQITGPSHIFEVHCSKYSNPADPSSIWGDATATDDKGVVAIMKGIRFHITEMATLQAGSKASIPVPRKQGLRTGQSSKETPLPRSDKPESSVDHKLNSTYKDSESSSILADDEIKGRAGLLSVISETTGVDVEHITPQTDLDTIGVDSMMVFELEKRLEGLLSQPPQAHEMMNCKTVESLETLVNLTPSGKGALEPEPEISNDSSIPSDIKGQQHINESQSSKPGPATPKDSLGKAEWDPEELDITEDMMSVLHSSLKLDRQPEGVQQHSGTSDSASLYLVHPGAGMCHEYYRIGNLDRPVYAIHDPRIFSHVKADWSSIDQMAEQYATIILDNHLRHPAESIILGGYSFGGLVAFETARLLMKRRECTVRGIILIDTPPPYNHKPMSKETIQAALSDKHLRSSRRRSDHTRNMEVVIAALAIRNNIRRGALIKQHQPKRD